MRHPMMTTIMDVMMLRGLAQGIAGLETLREAVWAGDCAPVQALARTLLSRSGRLTARDYLWLARLAAPVTVNKLD